MWFQRWRAVFALLLRAFRIAPLISYGVVAAGLLYPVLRPKMLVFAFMTLVGSVLWLFPAYLHLVLSQVSRSVGPIFSRALSFARQLSDCASDTREIVSAHHDPGPGFDPVRARERAKRSGPRCCICRHLHLDFAQVRAAPCRVR